ncbi:MAG TPA: alkaline phosphatase family protein, partial [Xanthomonadales bacterium]
MFNLYVKRASTLLTSRIKLWHSAVWLVLLSTFALISNAAQEPATPHSTPRLVLQITVDALRGDLPKRYANVLGDGGFRYLMEQGIDYTNANYQHANTETIVGHVSLATGSVPAAHGMIGNVWFDYE